MLPQHLAVGFEQKQGQELTKRCVPRVAQTCIRVTKTFPFLYYHFGHFGIIKKIAGYRRTDGLMDTPSYRDARTHLKTRKKWRKGLQLSVGGGGYPPAPDHLFHLKCTFFDFKKKLILEKIFLF